MADIYSKPSLSGYNSNPPADDGTQVASNEITWSKHKTKLGDPLKIYIDAINNETDAAFDRLVAPPNATDSGTDAYTGNSGRTLASGEVYVWDFQSANTTTTPTLNDNGQGTKTIKTRDGSALWAGAIQGVHSLKYNGTDYLILNPDTEQGSSPEHATDGGTDAYASATNTGTPGTGNTLIRDFQSANTTTTPTLDGVTIKTRDGSALWSGALDGPHRLEYDGTDYLLLDPAPGVQRDPTRAAGTSQKGDVELATLAEVEAATDSVRAVTPDRLGSAYQQPVLDDDTLTFHETDRQAVSGTSYVTIFDLSAATDLLGGTIMSTLPGFRLTVDGTVVANITSLIAGDDLAGDAFGVVHIPAAKALSSMKLEAYNASGGSRDFGWRVYTR